MQGQSIDFNNYWIALFNTSKACNIRHLLVCSEEVLLKVLCTRVIRTEILSIAQDGLGKAGRLTFPIAMLAYPFYLWKRSPGKEGSHYDPKCDLFTPAEEPLVSCCIPHAHLRHS